jgi:hypothetical protein
VFSLADTAQESTAMPEALPVYHPRDPTQSPLWNILHNNYEEFKANYDESYEKQYGFFRPVIDDVVHDYLKCGDLGISRSKKRTVWISPYWTYLITSLRGYHPRHGGSLSKRSERSIP